MSRKTKSSSSFGLKKLLLTLAFVVFALGSLYVVFRSQFQTRGNVKADSVGGIVIDHNSVALFDQIPDEFITRAREMKMLFVDQSVGVNISEGLSCLANTSIASAPNHCKRPSIPASEIVADVRYSRTNWINQVFPSGCGLWSTKVPCFINMVNSSYSTFDVVSYQFSYLDVDTNSTITSPTTGFFADPVHTSNLNAFETANPNKKVIYWTTSLSRSIGTAISTDFNNQMRAYAIANNKILFDVADIESHDPQGRPCYDNRDGVAYTNGTNSENYPDDGIDRPAICQSYTTETNGGHLGSVSTGKIRLAKAFWVLMAQIAGWVPTGQSNPTSAPIPTFTPIPQPTSTPRPASPTSIPSQVIPTPGTSDDSYYYGFESLNSGVFNGTVSPGTYGNSIYFNGINGYVNLGRLNFLDNASEFTFNIWIKPEFTNAESAWKYVFSDGSTFNLFYLGTTRNWRATLRTSNGTYRLDANGLSWVANSWHMVSVTYDGSTAKLFWDGVLRAEVSASGNISPAGGSAFIGQSAVNDSRFRGQIDELRIYRSNFSDPVILETYFSRR